jgi:hypothetical protein
MEKLHTKTVFSGGPRILRVGIQNIKVYNFFFDYESIIFGMYSCIGIIIA